MIQAQLKLDLTDRQERILGRWLFRLTGLWNWAIRKIELDARDGIYYSEFDMKNLVSGHSKKCGLPAHVMQGMASQAHTAWKRCFKKIAKRPRLKGFRNKLSSIPFPDPIKPAKGNRIALRRIGSLRFHRQEIPKGKIKCGRIVKRASGWYLCLFIDAQPEAIPHLAEGQVGIDPGFKHLLTFSTGEKIQHPRELEASAKRLAGAQRGNRRKLVGRLQEKIARQRKDRNHKLSRKIVGANSLICFSKDNHKAIAKRFGKSVMSSSHGQLRQMLTYKSRIGGRHYVEVSPRNSTKTCSTCGALTGPAGWDGLAVRQWVCDACGTSHDRDVNAAVNTLLAGLGDEPRNLESQSFALQGLEPPLSKTGATIPNNLGLKPGVLSV
jgi:putative transposase